MYSNDSYSAEKAYENLYESQWGSPKDCPDCDGTGKELEVYSCCGDIVESEDNDSCRTCGEHCGYEHEVCEVCNGEGVIS